MKLQFTTVLAALTLSACATTSPQDADRQVTFACTNGETIAVLFSPLKETAVLTRNGQNIELKQQRSGSGFIYSNGPNTIRGKGSDLTVNIGRMVPIQCTAK